MSYCGPSLEYQLTRIRSNCAAMIDAFGGHPERVLFAVKSFPSREIIGIAADLSMGFEVSNLAEYQMLPSDLGGVTVALNGTQETNVGPFLERGNKLIFNMPSRPRGSPPSGPGCRLGVRLCHTTIPLPDGQRERLAHSRFGMPWEELEQVAPLFRGGWLSGLHCHNGSEENSADFYRAFVEAVSTANCHHDLRLSYVDLGGGFHSLEDGELVALLRELGSGSHDFEVFIEPGQVLTRGAGRLRCRVTHVLQMSPQRLHVNLDASFDCHARWSTLNLEPPFGLEVRRMPHGRIPEPEEGCVDMVFNGATCFEGDRLGIYRVKAGGANPPLTVGDEVVFSNVTGYSAAWNTGFNGVAPAQVVYV